MSNRNYLRGRRWEYEVLQDKCGIKSHTKNGRCFALRTAGSHGKYDIVRVCLVDKVAEFLQLKVKKGKPGHKKVVMEPTTTISTFFNKWTKYSR